MKTDGQFSFNQFL